MFINCFIGTGLETKNFKRIHDTVVKRKSQVKNLIKQDKLFSATLIMVLDIFWNILIEEYEKDLILVDFSSCCFSARNRVNQIELYYFNFTLPALMPRKSNDRRNRNSKRLKSYNENSNVIHN